MSERYTSVTTRHQHHDCGTEQCRRTCICAFGCPFGYEPHRIPHNVSILCVRSLLVNSPPLPSVQYSRGSSRVPSHRFRRPPFPQPRIHRADRESPLVPIGCHVPTEEEKAKVLRTALPYISQPFRDTTRQLIIVKEQVGHPGNISQFRWYFARQSVPR